MSDLLARPSIGSYALIAAVVAVGAGAFLYTAGTLSPGRLTPDKMVAAFAPPEGAGLGHRRNHAKGICFTGTFEPNANASSVSRAAAFAPGTYPVVGRFNLGTADPNAPDATVRVRGLGLQILAQGQVWRMAMINAPVFAVSTPQAFYDLLTSQSEEAKKAFAARHPEFTKFAAWAQGGPWTASYAEETYNGLNAFLFVDGSSADHAVRWSFRPTAKVTTAAPDQIAKKGADALEEDIRERVRNGPQRWTMVATLANAGDQTADPSKAWPEGRKTIELGVLTATKIELERDGPCRDINFDPTILPDGVRLSDDPFPAARSAAYAKSYDLRSAEEKDYPRTATGANP